MASVELDATKFGLARSEWSRESHRPCQLSEIIDRELQSFLSRILPLKTFFSVEWLMATTCYVTTLKAMNMYKVYIVKGQEDKELSKVFRHHP